MYGRLRRGIGQILRDLCRQEDSATRIHRELLHTKGTLFGRSFWARGYCVSPVGLDEFQIRRYIRDQEKLQRDRDQGELNLD
jgi:putative transposase